jgi:hypothetical protein
MSTARSSHFTNPDGPVDRYYIHSGFGGPFPPMNLELREQFFRHLCRCVDFCGIRVLAFSLQPTEFHLIAEEDQHFKISKKDLLRRFKDFAPPELWEQKTPALKSNDPEAWRQLRNQVGGLSAFMKRFKGKMTRDYHRVNGTSGTIWSERFTAVVLQPGHASRVLAAWIHHAGVRRGVVDQPEEDLFNTFGRAVAGDKRARDMIAALFAEKPGYAWRRIAAAYRQFITTTVDEPAIPKTRTPRKPPLARPQLLETHVPHFAEGGAIGDREFIERVFQAHRGRFGPTRPDGARFIRGQDDPDLWALRWKPELRRTTGH